MKVKPKIPRKMEGRVSDVFSGSYKMGPPTHCKQHHFVGILDRWNSHCFVLTCLYFFFTTQLFGQLRASAHLPLSSFKTFSWHVSWSSVCKASCLLHLFFEPKSAYKTVQNVYPDQCPYKMIAPLSYRKETEIPGKEVRILLPVQALLACSCTTLMEPNGFPYIWTCCPLQWLFIIEGSTAGSPKRGQVSLTRWLAMERTISNHSKIVQTWWNIKNQGRKFHHFVHSLVFYTIL